MDSVYNFCLQNNLNLKCVSAERSEASQNIHYHVLALVQNEYLTTVVNNLWLNQIFVEKTRNEYAYYQYMIKNGVYKTFDYIPLLPDNVENDYTSAIMIYLLMIRVLMKSELNILNCLLDIIIQ